MEVLEDPEGPAGVVIVELDCGAIDGAAAPSSLVGTYPSNLLSDLHIVRDISKFCFPDEDALVSRMQRTPLACISQAATGEEFVFAITMPGKRLHGCCRRFRVLEPAGDGRVDSPARDFRVACICIVSPKAYFKLHFELLQLLQWLYMHQPSSIPVASHYFIVNFEKLATQQCPMTHFWRGLRQSLTPSIPAMLCFDTERLSLVARGASHAFEQIPLTPLLRCLGPKPLLALYTAMLCERRILFISQHLPILSSCIHAATSLLFPFEWPHVFIPIVPASLIDYCTPPLPFITGLQPSQLRSLDELGEIVLVDLDQGTVCVSPSCKPVPDLSGCLSPNSASTATAGEPSAGSAKPAKLTIIQRLQRLRLRQKAAKLADCPGSHLATALDTLLTRASDAGGFDEPAVRAAFIAFALHVAAHAADFVVSTAGVETLNRESFLAAHATQPCISCLLEEMRHSQMLEEFATGEFRRRRSGERASDVIRAALGNLRSSGTRVASFDCVMRTVLHAMQQVPRDSSPSALELLKNLEWKEKLPAATEESFIAWTAVPAAVNTLLGVIYARMSGCSGATWQQCVYAMQLLEKLIVRGSLRVAVLALSWLPLLRHLILIEHGSEWTPIAVASAAHADILGVAKTVVRGMSEREVMHAEGARMVSRQAARVYRLLASPKRLAIERMMALQPYPGFTYTPPYPYPLYTLAHVVDAKTALRGNSVAVRIPSTSTSNFGEIFLLFRHALTCRDLNPPLEHMQEPLSCWPDVARTVLAHALLVQRDIALLMSPSDILAVVAENMARHNFAALPPPQRAVIPAGVSAILEYHRRCLEAGDCRSEASSHGSHGSHGDDDTVPKDEELKDSFVVYFRQLHALLNAVADEGVLSTADCDCLTEIADAHETLFRCLVGVPGLLQSDIDRVLAAIRANMGRAMRQKYASGM